MEVRSCCFHFTEAFHSKVALLGLLLLLVGTLLPGVESLRILVVHPLYAGSHVLTLQVRKRLDHDFNQKKLFFPTMHLVNKF